MSANISFDDLVNLMKRLRAEGGCPWDIEQTHESLKPYLVEETYEVIDAIDSGNDEKLKEELADLLYQILFHSQISEENKTFTIKDVLNLGVEKMTRRHPHVFADSKAETTEEVLKQWNEIKKTEKGHEDRKYIVDGLPKHLPALQKAQKLQKKVSRVGFDWKDIRDVIAKVEEEFAELKAEITHIKEGAPSNEQAEFNKEAMEEEMGDLIFSMVNLARFLKLDSEIILHKTIYKFSNRFRHIEDALKAAGKSFEESTLEELDALWNKAKENIKSQKNETLK